MNNIELKIKDLKLNRVRISFAFFSLLLIVIMCFATFSEYVNFKDKDYSKHMDVVNKIFEQEIFKKSSDKSYEVIENFNGSKVYVVLNNDEQVSKKNPNPSDYLDSVDIDIDKIYFPTELNYFDNTNIAKEKKSLIEKAKKLGCNTLLTKMKDFFYHPYTECEYDKFSLDELKNIEQELEKLYSSQKEVDKAGPCGFVCDSLIANIKSVRKAKKNFDKDKHDKLSKLSQYVAKDSILGTAFKLNKNVVNAYFPIYESGYKRTPINSLSITDFKDNDELYYDANLKFRDPVGLPNEIGNDINVNDYLVVQTKVTNKDSSNTNVDKNNFIVFKCSKQYLYSDDFNEYDSDEFKKAYNGKKSSHLELIWGNGLNDEVVVYTEELESMFGILYNPDYDKPELSCYSLEFCPTDEGGGSISVEHSEPVRVKKNARVFGCYFYDFIDKYFSDDHDSEFTKNKNDEVYIKNLINKNISFNYQYGEMFFIPYVTDEKDSSNKTIIDNIKVLTYDDKGYVTGIYKGDN